MLPKTLIKTSEDFDTQYRRNSDFFDWMDFTPQIQGPDLAYLNIQAMMAISIHASYPYYSMRDVFGIESIEE